VKVSKSYIGKEVRLTWVDPTHFRFRAPEFPPVGKAALAQQVEYGVIDDITDSVIRISHTMTTYPGETVTAGTNYTYTLEDLVTALVVLEPVKTPEPPEGCGKP